MTLPIASTTFTVRRVTDDADDPWEAQGGRTSIATGVPAHISKPSARYEGVGSQETVKTLPFVCDAVVEILPGDEVVDERTQRTYQVAWARLRPQVFGLGCVEGALELTRGFA